MTRFLAILALPLAVITTAPQALGEPGKPVGIRWWGQSFITIETWWGSTIAIDPYALTVGYENPQVEADLVLITHEHFDHNNVEIVAGNAHVERALDRTGEPRRVNVVLDRYPNQDAARVSRGELRISRSSNAIWVENIPAYHDDSKGADRGWTGMFLIRVDGIRILHCGDLGQPRLTDDQLEHIGEVDLLLVPVGGVYTIDGPQAVTITEQISPRVVVPIHYKTQALTIDLETTDAFVEALPQKYERAMAVGNTVAIAQGAGPTKESPRVVMLRYEPWEMPAEMSALFDKKAQASRASQAVFRDLTSFQLNHKPSNGTHTPRWNVEHMAGTELLFMSRIMHQVDASIPVLNLSPRQMPPDYEAAHPEWPGPEQSQYMQRVSEFSRRFAFLLDGMPLDELPEGCPKFFGSLEGFLLKMEDHYGEHTANVEDKFELPDWPAQEE